MRVSSPLANMDIGIGAVRRRGNDLVLTSGADSSVQTVIVVSAREALGILGKIVSGSGLVFALGLPFFWLRQALGLGAAEASAKEEATPANINKPW
jgi:hypothetical protein